MKSIIESKNRIPTLIMTAILCVSMLLFCACDDNVPDDEDIEEVVTETTAATTVETTDSKKPGKSDNDDNDDNEGNSKSATKEKRNITIDEAINIALSRVPGATRNHLLHIEKDSDDGRISYEGEIYYNGVEYEFKIDASNGNILE